MDQYIFRRNGSKSQIVLVPKDGREPDLVKVFERDIGEVSESELEGQADED